jgi:glycine cleavage system H protein
MLLASCGTEPRGKRKGATLEEAAMSEIPGDLKYLKSHEWVRVEADGQARVGISDHAQSQLGDLVYVELPEVGDELERDTACAVVESVKAASDVYSPLSGEVVAVNESLADAPKLVNSSPYDDGWLFVVNMSDPSEVDAMMGPDDYSATLEDD